MSWGTNMHCKGLHALDQGALRCAAVATEAAPKSPDAPPAAPTVGFPKKTLYWIGGITAAIWAFAISTGSMIFMIVLGVLTAEERYVIVSTKMHGLGYRELAAELGKSADALKKLASRAMQRLRTGADEPRPIHL